MTVSILKLRCKCGTIVASVDSNSEIHNFASIFYFEYFFETGCSICYIMCTNCGMKYRVDQVLEAVNHKLKLNLKRVEAAVS